MALSDDIGIGDELTIALRKTRAGEKLTAFESFLMREYCEALDRMNREVQRVIHGR